jgi:hypothetical protein
MSHSASLSKRFMLVLYVVAWSVLLAAAGGWLTVYLVGTLGDSLARRTAPPDPARMFNSLVALTEKKVVRYLGEWEFLEPKLPGHFHHIGRWYDSDTSSFCIECHGPIPHARNPRERAFLNMHNLFISCQVCHVREQENVSLARFGWIDIMTGRLRPNPEMTTDAWGEYGAKIVPLKGSSGDPVPVELPEEKAFAAQFRQRRDGLSDSQKVIGNKFIHRRCTDKPVQCSSCHTTKAAFLPYTALGYSPERAAFLVSAEVVDLVQRYETFHMPKLLDPPEQEPRGPGDKKP